MARSPRLMLPLELAALAYAHDFVGIEEKGGDNRGPTVEFFQRCAKIPPGSPWCAAFVNACAELAAAVKNEYSPLEQVRHQGYVPSYNNWAEENGLLVPFDQAEPGDLFLLWFESKSRHAHIGFVDSVEPGSPSYRTVEGNTDDKASREGIKVARRERTAGRRDAFVHWA